MGHALSILQNVLLESLPLQEPSSGGRFICYSRIGKAFSSLTAIGRGLRIGINNLEPADHDR
jgi:hypothetical protein